MTGIEIMHEDKLAQWLLTIGKKQQKNTYEAEFMFFIIN